MIKKNMRIQGSTVTVLGFTFKENVPDLHNNRVIDIIRELENFDVNVQVTDAYVDSEEALEEHGIDLISYEKLRFAESAVFAVPH